MSYAVIPDEMWSHGSGESPSEDLNGDGLVNGADLGLLLAGWGEPGPTDLNGDGIDDVAGFDSGASQDNALHRFGLQSMNSHRNCQPTLARTSRSDPKGDDVFSDGVDVALLSGGFWADRATFGAAKNFIGQYRTWIFIGPNH